MKISVAMATYNGEKYILEQLKSILIQLEIDDEIVISDDGSKDNTIKIIEELMSCDKRIKLFKNPYNGVVSNFENAIRQCNNDIIFLSDQDDIWDKDKVLRIKYIFKNSEKSLVLHNGSHFFENKISEEIQLISNMHHGIYRNIYKSSYWGCCMAFRKSIVEYILPFPKNLVAHDQWIGLIAESRNESIFINEKLIKHRIHSKNVTRKSSLNEKIKFRINLLSSYFVYKLKIFKRMCIK